MYTFEVPGTPVAKPRPRAMATKKGNIRMYTPTNSKNFEFRIADLAKKIFDKPIKVPVKVKITFLMHRPRKYIWKTKPMPRIPCDKRPDIDNLFKSVVDGLNGIAFLDDGQIVEMNVLKLYHSGNEGPKTIIEVDTYD